MVQLQCKRCRNVVFDNTADKLKTVHNEPVADAVYNYHLQVRCDNKFEEIWHIGPNDVPNWMAEPISNYGWSRGRLKCQQCSSNLGAFDFVKGVKCPCTKFVVPPIHIVKSKVDCIV